MSKKPHLVVMLIGWVTWVMGGWKIYLREGYVL